MKDLKELDKIYKVNKTSSGTRLLLECRATSHYDDEGYLTVSEAIDLVNKGDERCFAGEEFGGLESFIVAKQLNDLIKKPCLDMYTSMFGNLVHLITKKPIVIPEDFTSANMENAKRICDATNEVFWLKPYEGATLNLESLRRTLKNMLENNTTFDIQELLENL